MPTKQNTLTRTTVTSEKGSTSFPNTVKVVDNLGIGLVSIVPNDSTVFTATKGLYVGVTGDVSVRMSNGTEVVMKNLASGVVHPLSATKVKATGTTATNLLAVY